jgi:hypothetical protein
MKELTQLRNHRNIKNLGKICEHISSLLAHQWTHTSNECKEYGKFSNTRHILLYIKELTLVRKHTNVCGKPLTGKQTSMNTWELTQIWNTMNARNLCNHSNISYPSLYIEELTHEKPYKCNNMLENILPWVKLPFTSENSQRWETLWI